MPIKGLTPKRKTIQHSNLEVTHIRQNNFEVKRSKVEVTGAKKGGPHTASAIAAALTCRSRKDI